MLRIWRRLSYLGVQEGMPAPTKRRILLANRISGLLLLLGVALGALMLRYTPVLVSLTLLCLLAVPLLNHKGYTKLSRLILALLPGVFIALGTALITPPEVAMPPGRLLLLSLLPLPLLLLDPQERLPFYLSLGTLLGLFLAYEPLNALLFPYHFKIITPEVLDLVRLPHVLAASGCIILAYVSALVANKEAEDKVEQLVRSMQQQNEALAKNISVLEGHQRKVDDSIEYARQIQRALMPSIRLLHAFPVEPLLLYRPMAVISGDFYALGNSDGRLVLAVVDCTDEGVASAFLSVMGSSIMSHLINVEQLTDPAELLEALDEAFKQRMKSFLQDDQRRQSLEVALAVFDFQLQLVRFAGANLPLYHHKEGKLTPWPGTERVIGQMPTPDAPLLPFDLRTLPMQPGDAFYLFTDGYAVQEGGMRALPYSESKLIHLLTELAPQPMAAQRAYLLDALRAWQGDHPQTDDVLAVGIRLKDTKESVV